MRSISRFVGMLAFVAGIPAAVAQDVGRVHFSSGEAHLERAGQATRLQASSPVRQGDVLRTGTDGHVQLVMLDGARIALRPKSELRLDRYEFNRTAAGAGQALLWLLSGTMRVFTGEIVERDRSRFMMKTNLATVGIRGSGNILANLDGGVTYNHTLTGSHYITSRDAMGIERTVFSFPGQTVQVLPGQAPRIVPTPALVMAAAAPPAARAEKSPEPAQATATSEAPAAAAGTASSGGTSSGGTSAGGTTPSETSSASSGTSTSTSTSTSTTTTTTTTTATTTTTTSAPSTTMTSTGTIPPPTVAASQATTGTVGSSIATAQPPAGSPYGVFLRFFNPIGSGYEGAVGQTVDPGTGAVLDASGRLVQAQDSVLATFLAGPGAPPPGYEETVLSGTIAFSGGTHHDAFRSPEGTLILGRWEGGTVTVGNGSNTRTFDLGPRSVYYEVITPTPWGVVGSFTGTSTYSLVSATAPTDSAGRAGTLGSASVSANFSARTVSGLFALAINGQGFSLTGNASLDPGSAGFSFASALQNLGISCSGSNCASAGYLGTMNGRFAGADGRWLSVSYRLNPVRASGSGFSDFVVGNIALEAGATPTIGIVLPQSGVVNLVFNGVDPGQSFSTYANATGTPSVAGTLQANFTNQTVSFNATVSGSGSPTLTATSSGAPIVGAGFSASTDAQRPSNVGAMTVTCSGTGCGSSPAGRFDGLFRNGAGTAGIASIVVGDSAGAYDVLSSFGSGSAAAALAARPASAQIPARFGRSR